MYLASSNPHPLPARVIIYLSLDPESYHDGQVSYSSDGEECCDEGPELWIREDEWDELGRPDQIKVTIEADHG